MRLLATPLHLTSLHRLHSSVPDLLTPPHLSAHLPLVPGLSTPPTASSQHKEERRCDLSCDLTHLPPRDATVSCWPCTKLRGSHPPASLPCTYDLTRRFTLNSVFSHPDSEGEVPHNTKQVSRRWSPNIFHWREFLLLFLLWAASEILTPQHPLRGSATPLLNLIPSCFPPSCVPS